MFKLNHIKNDFYGGTTTAVVALPLALAFGVTSGIGAIAGLWGAIILGFLAALFGGTKSQISGPTSPMTIVMSGIVLTYNNELDLIFTIVVLTGLIQILFGILRIGKYIQYVPSPVISGFVTGIGCIIIIIQFGPMLGHQLQGKIFDILQNLMIINNINNDSRCQGHHAFRSVSHRQRLLSARPPRLPDAFYYLDSRECSAKKGHGEKPPANA